MGEQDGAPAKLSYRKVIFWSGVLIALEVIVPLSSYWPESEDWAEEERGGIGFCNIRFLQLFRI